MKLDLKFGLGLLAPVVMIIFFVGWLSGPFAEHLIYTWSIKDLNLRAHLISNSLSEGVISDLNTQNSSKVRRQFESLVKDEKLYALGFCTADKKISNASQEFFSDFQCSSQCDLEKKDGETLILPSGKHFFVNCIPISDKGMMIAVHDLTFVQSRTSETRHFLQMATIAFATILAILILLMAEIIRRLWIRGVRQGILGWGQNIPRDKKNSFDPIINDVRNLIAQLESERKVWNKASIRQLIQDELRESEIFIVSNREPYIHHKNEDGSLDLERPASGLVTALEPIVSACNGTWIAHGSGNGDQESVDENDCVWMPPEDPTFKLKRVWLTPEEKRGYYEGFSNEALWPLCLLTHTRPIFRTSDWEMYKKINRRFADAVIREAKSKNPLVLVQDYHFALVPQMIRERLPEANIITFWHIPWPNPEIFNICPWREEILDGLLGSQIIGFHTSSHVQNFMRSVQQTVESKADLVNGQIHYNGIVSKIAAYPMSVDWQDINLYQTPEGAEAVKSVLQENNLPAHVKIGVGIDRLDYTKGILERFHAVERMIELNPALEGQFSFVQIAAPSRTEINAYQDYAIEIHREVERINKRFGKNTPLIVLREFHHDKEQVYKYCRAASLCFISSLHDGMNLVAKEFIASRADEQGVLVLSRFTGAAVNFPDALLVNPYHVDECADALARAIYMHPEEQKARMSAMRRYVREHNIFRWAGYLLLDSAEIQRIRSMVDGPDTNISAFPGGQNKGAA